jgi:hypothetical protein
VGTCGRIPRSASSDEIGAGPSGDEAVTRLSHGQYVATAGEWTCDRSSAQWTLHVDVTGDGFAQRVRGLIAGSDFVHVRLRAPDGTPDREERARRALVLAVDVRMPDLFLRGELPESIRFTQADIEYAVSQVVKPVELPECDPGTEIASETFDG